MNYDKTELYFLQRDCLLRFGEEKGELIFFRASKLYSELVVTTDYRNSPATERQLKQLIFPVIAYYKTLRFFGYREQEALSLVRNETEKAAKGCAAVLSNQNRKIFPFYAFKRNIKRFLASKFPPPYCCYTDLRLQGKEITLKIGSCIYYGITHKFGCPELCGIFCDYEKVAFAGLAPKIDCERGNIIAEGHENCDFIFRKGEKAK